MNKLLANTTLAMTIACGASFLQASPSSLNVYYQNYNNFHNYKKADLDADMGDVLLYSNIDDSEYSIREYPANSGYKRLLVKFNQGEYGSDQLTGLHTQLAGSKNYTIEYSARFANDWQFVKGGKLPGIAAGSHPAGGTPARDGMSARIMWREDNVWDGTYGGSSKSYLEVYHYWRGQAIAYNHGNGDTSRQYGDRTYLVDATKNAWYHIKIKVELGTATNHGRLRVWVNNTVKHDDRYRYFDSGDDWDISRVMLVFFYGGGTSAWAPSQNTSLFFDNLKVYQ